jgi:hypothetical protein
MIYKYLDNTVLNFIEKIFSLSWYLDKRGKMDFWYYGLTPKRMPPLTIKNIGSAVPQDWMDLMHSLGLGNNESAVMKLVMKEYERSPLPSFVIFITDGVFSSESAVRDLLVESSHFPIFWRFLGLGQADYGVLERLDRITGRVINNADFSIIYDIKKLKSEPLLTDLVRKFPLWLSQAKEKKIIRS